MIWDDIPWDQKSARHIVYSCSSDENVQPLNFIIHSVYTTSNIRNIYQPNTFLYPYIVI